MIALATLAESQRRQRRDRETENVSRLEIDTARSDGGGVLLDVKYRPGAGHTRFAAVLRSIDPAEAGFSAPRWADSDAGSLVILPPMQEFDPSARRSKVFKAPLDEEREPGVIGTVVGLWAPQMKARIKIEIVDIATDKAVLSTVQSVAA